MDHVATSESWLRRYRPSPTAAARLICFPYAGGSATTYLPLAESLSPQIEVAAIQYPGRQDRWREPLRRDINQLADEIALALSSYLEGQQFAFFGHSMGAIVAYEVTRRWAAAQPTTLFVSGRSAPSLPPRSPVDTTSDESVVAGLLDLGGFDPRILQDEEVRQLVLPIVRADLDAVQRYRWSPPAEPLKCPIVALVGDNDPITTIDEAQSWASHSKTGAEVLVYEGGHFFINDHWDEISRLVTDRFGLLGHSSNSAD